MTDVMRHASQEGSGTGLDENTVPFNNEPESPALSAGDFSIKRNLNPFETAMMPLLHKLGATSEDPDEALDELYGQVEEARLRELKLQADEIPTVLVHGQAIIDNKPTDFTGEFPEEPLYPGVGLLVPGFGGFKRTSRGLRHAKAVLGQGSISYDPKRADDRNTRERLADPQQVHLDTISAIAHEIATNTFFQKQVPQYKKVDFERLVLGPHSMGGPPAFRFAEQNPDDVDAVIGLATVGFGSPSLGRLARTLPLKVPSSIRKEFLPYLFSDELDATPKNLLRIIHYYGRNPARTIGEVYSCLTEDVHDNVKHLHTLGVFTAYLAFKHDVLVPDTEHVEDVVDFYEVMEGAGHLAPQAKSRRVAEWMLGTYQNHVLAA